MRGCRRRLKGYSLGLRSGGGGRGAEVEDMEVEGVQLEVKGWRKRWRLRECSLRLRGRSVG